MFYPVNGDPFRSNVVLHLPMTGADNGTSFVDVSPTPKTITRYGNTKISTAQSKWGQGSGYYDGSGDYLSIADHSHLKFDGPFTMEMWLFFDKSNQSGNNISVLYKGAFQTAGAYVLQFGVSENQFNFQAYTAGDYAISIWGGTLDTNTWTHLAISRDANNDVRLFKNGTQSATGNTAVNMNNTSSLLIAANASRQYKGYIQDLRITKGVALYTANFAVPVGPLASRLPELPVRRIQPHPFHSIARLGL